MATFFQDGDALDFTAPSGGVVAGLFYKIGVTLVFASVSAAAGALFAGYVEGVYEDAAAATSQAWTEGAVLYWDDTNKKFTTTASGNTKAGIAAAAKASAAAVGRVKLVLTL
ncbi:DUF2190 family protein [Sphingomonas hengshuiensis]|uniref:DUF2190 domain-containing protein n=1 Tax=Sphingomonas hengshuiensis TaxID=1609977 RepID=A0A7U4J8N0_9SPHN|nr:DUF2190 family protein [Sphingomonas hengshuiensis]AJP72271.1 hypothetical protein TS85_11445 [Sphingomonas hengshuiensis]